MVELEDVLLPPETTIHRALEQLVRNMRQIVLVVDEERRLLGTVTDGDIRRGLLKRIDLDEPISRIMNRAPAKAGPDTNRDTRLRIMEENEYRHLPIVDEDGRVVALEVLSELLKQDRLENPVVILAGGKGRRLMPLTQDLPKPMLPVGGRPMLETIIEGFARQRFHRFFLSVNYKSEIIEDHFGDGSSLGVSITYLREDQPLGTAGPLSALPDRPDNPIFVMNGDLLTSIDFKQLLTFHQDQKSDATMCVREYDFEVPFGVAEIDGTRLTGISEKPVQRFFVNAGIYLLNPSVLSMVPKNEPFDMPELFKRVLARGMNAAAFPLREYWMDIGRISDFEQAQRDFPEVFG
jgi:dTDP-glucose pyrophosphorylase